MPIPLVARIASWFGPGQVTPVQADPPPTGRQFDFPVGWNLRTQPRQDEALSFGQLRALSDGWDLLRLVIETRKDQIAALRWSVKPRQGMTADDARLQYLTSFLRFPDRDHGWAQWVRILLEDLFVLDAPVLYPRRDRMGRLAGLEVIDGATIKRVLASDGRTPIPPDPAYQQILKGVPAVDYSADELIYAPRNPRAHKVYGFSPVEQIVMTINVALRRQASQLAYFTEGNTPEALIGVPENWSPEQIRQFQEYWDALLEGNLAARRHTRFVPGGLSYQPTRDVPLKDDFDDWLARVVCFAFSVPPTALIRQINRATAETANNTALTEGLAPLMLWLKDLIDRVIAQVLRWDDIEFIWNDAVSVDLVQQAQIDVAYVTAGIKTRDEVRAALGLPVAGHAPVEKQVRDCGCLRKAGFNQAQPRDDDGKWTDQGGGASAGTGLAFLPPVVEPLIEPLLEPLDPVPPTVDTPGENAPPEGRGPLTNPYPDDPECREEWDDAEEFCEEKRKNGELKRGSPWGKDYATCLRGQVSYRCGGNPFEV